MAMKIVYLVAIALLGITSIVGFFGQMPLQEPVLDYIYGDRIGSTNDGSNVEDDSNLDETDDTTSSVYPALSNVKHDKNWYESKFYLDGYRWVFGNDDRAGSATISWLKKVQTQAEDKMKHTDRDDALVFNDYVRSAAKQKGVAQLEEYESGIRYPDGRDIVLFVDNNDGETQVLKVAKEDTEFDLTDLENPEDVLSTPEETVPVSEVESWWEKAQKALTPQNETPAPVVEQKVETPAPAPAPAAEQTVVAPAATQQVIETPAPAASQQAYKSVRPSNGGSNAGSAPAAPTSGTGAYKSVRN